MEPGIEMEGNGTDDLVLDLENERFLTYRSFQLLNKSFNCCFSPVILPALQYFQTAALVFSNFNIIQFHHRLDWSILILMSFYSFTLIVGRSAIYFKYGASVFTRSAKLTSTYKVSRMIGKVHRKGWSSFTSLKIVIGPFNFMKRETPFLAFGVILYSTMKMIVALPNAGANINK